VLAALNPPPRYLLGPGPAPVEPSVLAAMGRPLLGRDDPEFVRIVEQVLDGLRSAFRTANRLTLALPGSSATAMEAALANLIEPDDSVVVGVNGLGGQRMADAARRAGGRVSEVAAPWGQPIPTEQLAQAARQRGAKVVAVVHADGSTGTRQAVEELRDALGGDRLLVVDGATSLGGIPLEVEAWGIDACFSVTDQCLSAPPGLALVTFSRRVEDLLGRRAEPVRSWHLDLARLRDAPDSLPANLIYGLHEGLRLVEREGLEARWKRHAEAGRFLQESLEELGFEILASPGHRVPQLTVARLPEGIDDDLRHVLLEDFDIAVGGGVGELAGRAWRIGLMGFGARREHALRLLQALRALFSIPGGLARARR
jgi:alanine-glyoxylate transaminase/serine-glyoxylate transaminase/serine-pyruvate transaminase